MRICCCFMSLWTESLGFGLLNKMHFWIFHNSLVFYRLNKYLLNWKIAYRFISAGNNCCSVLISFFLSSVRVLSAEKQLQLSFPLDLGSAMTAVWRVSLNCCRALSCCLCYIFVIYLDLCSFPGEVWWCLISWSDNPWLGLYLQPATAIIISYG